MAKTGHQLRNMFKDKTHSVVNHRHKHFRTVAQLFCHFSFLPVACQIDSAQIKSVLFLRNQGP